MDFAVETDYEQELGSMALDGSAFYTRLARTSQADAPPPARDRTADYFRETMRALASGVVLITTYVGERPWGVTVTSCCSLSLQPPRLLVSLMRGTASCQAIEHCGAFGVDLLGDAHRRLAQTGAARGTPKFIDPEVLAAPGERTRSPMVAGALSHVDCEVEQMFDGGDHAIILGRVQAVVTAHPCSSASPLLYFDGGYYHLGTPL